MNDVRFVKDGVARALRTLRAATSPEPADRVGSLSPQMIAESPAAEAAREIERLLGADATQTLGDMPAAAPDACVMTAHDPAQRRGDMAVPHHSSTGRARRRDVRRPVGRGAAPCRHLDGAEL